MGIKDLVQRVREYRPAADVQLIEKAYHNQSLSVAELLTELKMDEKTIAAALLHDVKDLEGEFGQTVADLVDGVTAIKKVRTKTGEYHQTDNLRKLLLATAKDVRVVLIRLAEKLDSLQKIEGLPESLREETAQKALDIYAPLAERLGVHHFKWQLEDWAFKYQNPAEHVRIQKFLDQKREDREKYIQKVVKIVGAELKKEGIGAKVYGRPKHFYAIFKKTIKYQREGQGPSLEKILDEQALTILTETEEKCYQALSVVHHLFRPVEGEFDDYIAHPKPNGYRAIHTTVIGPEARVVEIQIKTPKMHEYNEFGPAAHTYYKEVGKREALPTDRFSWLKSLVEWQEEVKSEAEFEEALKIDVFGDRVFVFTPKGDVLDLPKGATPLDFAYKLHTELGDSCVGAKVDGKLVPLSYQLQTNQTVEILTSKRKKKPSTDWLGIVKTTEARAKIRKSLRAV